MNKNIEEKVKEIYVLISKIPLDYHAADLRHFFSFSVEKEFFICFNYRHRADSSKKSNICFCKLKSYKYDEFLKLYDQKEWFNAKDQFKLDLKCSILKIKTKNLERLEDLESLLEFKNIPKWMPQGNVGTPTKVFLEYINQCIMPQSLIAKLGINIKHYKKCKNKTYTNVEFKYEQEEEELEDWERHESLHDDVTKQDRTSPYLFENEIELQWEKGGSGLVFYTDDNYWKEQENKDFDAETADDWDLDMSVYYEANGGDLDSRDLLDMRRMDMLRSGVDPSLLDDEIKLNSKKRLNPFKQDEISNKKIGYFEKYTKGFGRRQMEKLGWKEGQTIGVRSGLKEPLDSSEGKNPLDKTGIGYYGQKIDRDLLIKKQKEQREKKTK